MANHKAVETNEAWETVKVIIQALLLALIVRTFFFQPFNIPSGSMKSTLLVGDYIFVSKMSYGYSKHSFPFSTGPFEGRVWEEAPERGDVAVFKLPTNTSIDYIKRVIGLPGDQIQVRDGVLYINNDAVQREQVEDYVETLPDGTTRSVTRYRETLPNGTTYMTLDGVENSVGDNTKIFVVPDGHYFMMGDNRDNSQDSRFQNAVGYVPLENFVGEAKVIFFSLGDGASAWQLWKWPTSLRPSRIFSSID